MQNQVVLEMLRKLFVTCFALVFMSCAAESERLIEIEICLDQGGEWADEVCVFDKAAQPMCKPNLGHAEGYVCQ